MLALPAIPSEPFAKRTFSFGFKALDFTVKTAVFVAVSLTT